MARATSASSSLLPIAERINEPERGVLLLRSIGNYQTHFQSPGLTSDRHAAIVGELEKSKSNARTDMADSQEDIPAAQGEHDDQRKYGGRKKGTLNKRTIAKLRAAEHELEAARSGKRLAIDHMDEMIDYFSNLVGLLAPWNPNGTRREDRSVDLWFRSVAAFQGFLAMRARYQTPRMSAVAIVPPAVRQRTTVHVTILNERGEKVFSDSDENAGGELGDGAKPIEGREDDAAA
jgi:hypothetical protein